MARLDRRHRSRLLALALFGLLATLAPAPRARGGCHVADPPATLGLLLIDRAVEIPARLDLSLLRSEAPPGVSPRPCRDESPGGSSRSATPISPALVLATVACPEPGDGEASLSLPDTLSSTDGPSRLDRPPRAARLS